VSGKPATPALEDQGPAAPPRRNGELVFEAPWEGRAFGLAIALHERGLFEWEEFRRNLIRTIAAWDETHASDEAYCYYDHWLTALDQTLVARGLCRPGEIDARAERFAARPPDHDH